MCVYIVNKETVNKKRGHEVVVGRTAAQGGVEGR